MTAISAPANDSSLREYHRFRFDLTAERPIRLVRDRWTDARASLFDMHYELEIGIVARGGMVRKFGSEWQMEVGPGDVWLTGMWEPHGVEISQAPCEVFVWIFSPDLLARNNHQGFNWLAPFIEPAASRPRLQPKLKKFSLSIVRQLNRIAARDDPRQPLWLQTLLNETLLLVCDGWSSTSLREACQGIHGYQRIQPSLALAFEKKTFVAEAEAARACGMCRNGFAKLFRSIMGLSFPEFCLRFRLTGAAEQVAHTDLPLKAIAEEWGFVDVSHLHRTIVKYYGVTPAHYRRAFQEPDGG